VPPSGGSRFSTALSGSQFHTSGFAGGWVIWEKIWSAEIVFLGEGRPIFVGKRRLNWHRGNILGYDLREK